MSTALVGQIDSVMNHDPVYFLYINITYLNEKSFFWQLTDVCAHKTEMQSWDHIYTFHEITHYSADLGETPTCFSQNEQPLSEPMVLQALPGQDDSSIR